MRAEAARVQTADHGAHAGAGNRIDRNVQLLEDLEHADVRRTARTAAGEHEADARPMRGGAGTRAEPGLPRSERWRCSNTRATDLRKYNRRPRDGAGPPVVKSRRKNTACRAQKLIRPLTFAAAIAASIVHRRARCSRAIRRRDSRAWLLTSFGSAAPARPIAGCQRLGLLWRRRVRAAFLQPRPDQARQCLAPHVAWTYRTGELGAGFARANKLTFEATPVLAFGLLYLETATNIVIALDPETGAQKLAIRSEDRPQAPLLGRAPRAA